VRRRIYEVIRQELSKVKDNTDIVVIVFSAEVMSLPSSELTQSIQQLMEEADIYKK
jgi:ribonuclease P protein component